MKFNYYYAIILIPLMAILIVGCAGKTQVKTGISLSDTYLALHTEFLNIYDKADKKTQKYMQKNIAPKMNRVKQEIIEYNEIVLIDGDGTDKKDAIIEKLREVAKELTEVK